MDVYTFCQLLTDDSAEIRIFDMNEDVEEEVFSGAARQAQYSEWTGCDVESFDLCRGNIHESWEPYIILNIDTTEED